MEALLRERLAVRGRCRVGARLRHGQTRYVCHGRHAAYLVDWQHYGTGRYVIRERRKSGPDRIAAHGTLSISE